MRGVIIELGEWLVLELGLRLLLTVGVDTRVHQVIRLLIKLTFPLLPSTPQIVWLRTLISMRRLRYPHQVRRLQRVIFIKQQITPRLSLIRLNRLPIELLTPRLGLTHSTISQELLHQQVVSRRQVVMPIRFNRLLAGFNVQLQHLHVLQNVVIHRDFVIPHD